MTVIKEDQIGNFSISYEDIAEHKCLRLTLHGNYNRHCGEVVVREADYLLKNHNYLRCLFDLNDAVYDMSFTEIFFQAEFWDEASISRDYKIAYVSEHPAQDDTLKFLDNVLNNRGWKAERFRSMHNAFEWLDPPSQEASPAKKYRLKIS